MAAVWKAREKLVGFTIAATGNFANNSTKYDEANAALVELRALSATLPPESGDVKAVLAALQSVFRNGGRLAVPDGDLPGRTDRGRLAVVTKEKADEAVILAERLALAWNKALWESSTAMPAEVKE